jgi:hypothetical protein
MSKDKQSSSSLFWLKHVLLAIAILVIGGIVLFLQISRQSEVKPEGQKPRSIAESMSSFYSDYKFTSRHPHQEDLGDFVITFKTPAEPLTDRLKKMESLQKPASGRWVGEHKHRSFKSGSTLRSAITEYAQSEGMQVIWELDRDFIIKHTFQLDDSILGSLRKIARAVDANFEGEVKAYMCPKQRSLVITETTTDYLTRYCRLANR